MAANYRTNKRWNISTDHQSTSDKRDLVRHTDELQKVVEATASHEILHDDARNNSHLAKISEILSKISKMAIPNRQPSWSKVCVFIFIIWEFFYHKYHAGNIVSNSTIYLHQTQLSQCTRLCLVSLYF